MAMKKEYIQIFLSQNHWLVNCHIVYSSIIAYYTAFCYLNLHERVGRLNGTMATVCIILECPILIDVLYKQTGFDG